MAYAVFWDVTPCNQVQAHWHFWKYVTPLSSGSKRKSCKKTPTCNQQAEIYSIPFPLSMTALQQMNKSGNEKMLSIYSVCPCPFNLSIKCFTVACVTFIPAAAHVLFFLHYHMCSQTCHTVYKSLFWNICVQGVCNVWRLSSPWKVL